MRLHTVWHVHEKLTVAMSTPKQKHSRPNFFMDTRSRVYASQKSSGSLAGRPEKSAAVLDVARAPVLQCWASAALRDNMDKLSPRQQYINQRKLIIGVADIVSANHRTSTIGTSSPVAPAFNTGHSSPMSVLVRCTQTP